MPKTTSLLLLVLSVTLIGCQSHRYVAAVTTDDSIDNYGAEGVYSVRLVLVEIDGVGAGKALLNEGFSLVPNSPGHLALEHQVNVDQPDGTVVVEIKRGVRVDGEVIEDQHGAIGTYHFSVTRDNQEVWHQTIETRLPVSKFAAGTSFVAGVDRRRPRWVIQ